MSEGLYRFIHAVARFVFGILYPVRAEGTTHVPLTGAVILCSNHIANIDPICMACALKRPVRFMAKAELFAVKPLKAFLEKLGAFAVKRGEMDMSAMRTSFQVLKEGGALGIYPQGTRDKTNSRPMASGVGFIAQRSKAQVIPVRVFGPYRLFRKTRLVFGAPVDLADVGLTGSAAVDEMTRRIEAAVWALK